MTDDVAKSVKDQKDLYNRIWMRSFDRGEYLMPSDRIKSKLIYTTLDIKKTQRVLDIGCGIGTMLIAAAGIGTDTVGIDISKEGLKKAKRKIKSGSFITGDVQVLPFKNDTFDAIICKDILEHLPNDDIALSEIYRVLRPKGSVIIYVPHNGVLSFEWFISKIIGYNYIDSGSGHLRRYKSKEIISLLEKTNFYISKKNYFAHYFISITDIFFIFMRHHFLVKPYISKNNGDSH